MDNSKTDESRTFLTANCSFVTSYPNIPDDAPNDSGIFKFSASDSAAVLALLNNLEDNNGKKALDNIKVDAPVGETEDGKQARFEKNQKTVYQLFEKSIDNILKTENSNANTVIGMQEINNTKQVHNTLSEKLREKGRFFVCSNVHDEIVKTYPTLGYILPGTVDQYLPLKDEAQSKIFRNGRDNYKYDAVQDNDAKEKAKSHSLCNYELNTIMAIRDLGSTQDLHSFPKGGKTYYILKNKDGTDSGRPISMVIKGNRNTTTPQEIYINCHMLNASILKIFRKGPNEKEYIPQKFHDGTLSDVDEKAASTLLQMGDIIIPESGKSGTILWLEYCIKRLQATINELLDDFDVGGKLNSNTKVFIMGDFNDPEGKLLDKLEKDGIKIGGLKFKFKFGDRVKSCCPNRNSAIPKEDKKGTEEENMKFVEEKMKYVKKIMKFVEEEKMKYVKKIMKFVEEGKCTEEERMKYVKEIMIFVEEIMKIVEEEKMKYVKKIMKFVEEGKGTEEEKMKYVKEIMKFVKEQEPFNEKLPELITDKTGKKGTAIKIFGYEPMFAGDNVGEGYVFVEGQHPNVPTVTAELIDERTSDHGFVKTTHTPPADTTGVPPAGGKRRTRRRRRRSTRRNKRRMSGRRRRRLTRRKR